MEARVRVFCIAATPSMYPISSGCNKRHDIEVRRSA
jgi:hypothetical protein